ncbi:MAG: hypothetical protein WCR01_07765 [Bacteroidota bacterium]
MTRKSFPQFIIISGSGKKVGKTYLAVNLIRSFSGKFPLLALKISPHLHDSLGNSGMVAASAGIRIFQDMEPHRKNSGKFLEAGAARSFFMETDDEHLAEAFERFMKECNPQNEPVIIESGALGHLIQPGLLIFINSPPELTREVKLKTMNMADLVLPARLFDPGKISDQIGFSENRWHLVTD